MNDVVKINDRKIESECNDLRKSSFPWVMERPNEPCPKHVFLENEFSKKIYNQTGHESECKLVIQSLLEILTLKTIMVVKGLLANTKIDNEPFYGMRIFNSNQ